MCLSICLSVTLCLRFCICFYVCVLRMGYIGASVSDVHANSIRYGIATASDCIRCIHLHLADILHGGDFP